MAKFPLRPRITGVVSMAKIFNIKKSIFKADIIKNRLNWINRKIFFLNFFEINFEFVSKSPLGPHLRAMESMKKTPSDFTICYQTQDLCI